MSTLSLVFVGARVDLQAFKGYSENVIAVERESEHTMHTLG